MGTRYNNYTNAINNKLKVGVRKDFLSQNLPIIQNIKTLASQNESLLNYFTGVSKELETWVTNIPTDNQSIQNFHKNLTGIVQALSILKNKVENFDSTNIHHTIKTEYSNTASNIKSSMQCSQITTMTQQMEQLNQKVIAYKKSVKEAEEKAIKDAAEAERLRKEQAAAAILAEKNRIEKERLRKEREAAEEAERIRRAKEEEERRKKELYINIAKWAGIIIGSILLLIFIIIPIGLWIWTNIVYIIIGLIIIGYLAFKK